MAADDVLPHVGIRTHAGLVRLGMTREEVQPLLGRNRDLQVEYRGSPERVAFIQAPKHWGTLDGIKLFESAADEVIAEIVRRFGFDPVIYHPGKHTYYFPALNLLLWRDCVSDEEDEQGYVFDCVSVHTPDCYDAPTLAYLRAQTGLPPLPE